MPGVTRGDLSDEEFNWVRHHIARCLRRNMIREETMYILSVQFRIYPGFTALVWEMLEDENPEFFNRYYLRLMMNNHIMEFNRLLRQVQQMNLMYWLNSNGSRILPRVAGMITIVRQERSVFRNGNMRLAVTIYQIIFITQAGFLSQNINMIRGVTVDANSARTLAGFLSHIGNRGVLGMMNRNSVRTQTGFLSQNRNMGSVGVMNRNSVRTQAGFLSQDRNIGLVGAINWNTVRTQATGFLSQNRNMGLVGTMNRDTVRTQAGSSTQHLNATLLDGDTSAVGSSTQASNLPEFPRSPLIDNLRAPESSDANNIVDPHGDIESRLDPASGSSKHQNRGGD